MTLKIEIIADPRGDLPLAKQLDNAMEALGFQRTINRILDMPQLTQPTPHREKFEPPIETAEQFKELLDNRTPEEVEKSVYIQEQVEPEKPKRGRKPKIETTAISTGAERVDPAVTEEDAAQDAADEARETAQAKEASGGALTRDDVRKAAGEYIKRYGMAVAQADIPAILGCTQVEIPDTQEALGDAVTKLRIAIEENPHGRDVVGDPKVEPVKTATATPAPTATEQKTKDDVVAVILAYAEKFDGTRNPADLTQDSYVMVDGAQVLQALFGEGVKKISQIPATGEAYGQAVAGLTKMLETNQFGREARG